MRRLDQEPSSVGLSLAADVAGVCGTIARLTHARVQAQIPNQLVGAREATDVADDGDEGERSCGPDTGDRHQTLHTLVPQRFLGDLGVGNGNLGLERVQQPQRALYLATLPRRQRRFCQPSPPPLTEGVAEGTVEEVAMEDGLDPVAEPGALLEQRAAVSDLSPASARRLIRRPHLPE